MNNLFVIIVTYNGEKWIQKCLSSVIESTITSNVIVIDNNSNDQTLNIIEKEFPSVTLFKSKTNLGFGKANNIGIEYAINNNADYIYLLNQDAWIETDTFEHLIRIHKKNPIYGILSPMQMNSSKNRFDNNFASLCISKNKDQILSDMYINQYKKKVYEVDFVMASHWLISKDCILSTGGFSPIFYHYGEDNNLIDRIHFHGYKSGICPHINTVHDREYRKRKPHESFYLKYTSGFLVTINNINYSLTKALIKSYSELIYDELVYSIKHKSFRPFFYIFKSLFSVRKCLANRKKTKNKGTCFLSINNKSNE